MRYSRVPYIADTQIKKSKEKSLEYIERKVVMHWLLIILVLMWYGNRESHVQTDY